MSSVKELEKLIKSTKDLKERKKELEKQKNPADLIKETKKEKKEIKEEQIKNKMQRLRKEVSEIKGSDLEKEDIDGLIIKEKEPQHLWLKNKEKKEKQKEENPEDKKSYFREGHWDKTEKQKKENKMSSLNINIEEKALHPKEAEEPKEKKQVLEILKETASKYKEIEKAGKLNKKEKIFEKGVSEELITKKISAEKILPEKKPKLTKSEEESILKGFILENPKKEQTAKEKKEKKKGGEFQTIKYKEPAPKKISLKPEERMQKLQGMIPVNPEAIPKGKEAEEDNLTVAQQLGNVKNFFTKGLIRGIGRKQIDKKEFTGLTKEEKKQVKKLVSSLDVAIKKYTKEEIIEAMQLEGQPAKVINAVIKILYN